MKSALKKILALSIAAVMTLSLFVTSFAAYKGDIDGNGEINSTDALIALKCSVGSYDGEVDMTLADMDGNGTINSTDALKILRISVGLDAAEEIPDEPDEPDEPEYTVPSTTAEIAEYYNTAINKVVDEKAGYAKKRTTEVKEMNGPSTIMSMAEGVIKDFLGDGTKEYKNAKGTAKHFLKSELVSDDVKSATCMLDEDGNYTITITLNDGQSSATKSKKTDTSSVAKSGLTKGKVADSDYDYLSSESIYSAITSASSSLKVESVTSNNTDVQVVAVVEAASGKLVSLTISYNWTVVIKNLKVSFISADKADGKASTKVELSDFEW